MPDLIADNWKWALIPVLGLVGIGVYTAIRHRWVTRESLRPGGSLVTTVIHPVWFEYALLLAAPGLVMAWRDEERIRFALLIAGVALLPIHIHRSRALFLSSLMAFWLAAIIWIVLVFQHILSMDHEDLCLLVDCHLWEVPFEVPDPLRDIRIPLAWYLAFGLIFMTVHRRFTWPRYLLGIVLSCLLVPCLCIPLSMRGMDSLDWFVYSLSVIVPAVMLPFLPNARARVEQCLGIRLSSRMDQQAPARPCHGSGVDHLAIVVVTLLLCLSAWMDLCDRYLRWWPMQAVSIHPADAARIDPLANEGPLDRVLWDWSFWWEVDRAEPLPPYDLIGPLEPAEFDAMLAGVERSKVDGPLRDLTPLLEAMEQFRAVDRLFPPAGRGFRELHLERMTDPVRWLALRAALRMQAGEWDMALRDIDLIWTTAILAISSDPEEGYSAYEMMDIGSQISYQYIARFRDNPEAMEALLEVCHTHARTRARLLHTGAIMFPGKPGPLLIYGEFDPTYPSFMDDIRHSSYAVIRFDQIRIAAAVHGYTLREGRPPSEIGDLVPADLSQIPLDPFHQSSYTIQFQGQSLIIDPEKKSPGSRWAIFRLPFSSKYGKPTSQPSPFGNWGWM